MAKSFFDETEEQLGSIPALTGALLTIKGVERTKTGDRAKTPGCRMYVFDFQIEEPEEFKGMHVRDYITIGTEKDPSGKQPETWKRREGGPGRLKRLLTRSGTPISDDDEEWMEAAEGRQVVAPIRTREDDNGVTRNNVGMYFRPNDEDAPEIGEADPSTTGKKAKGAAAAAKRARASAKEVVAEEEEEPRATAVPTTDDDEDEE